MIAAAPPGRDLAIDIARGLALLGVCCLDFVGVMEASAAGPAWAVTATDLVNGHAAALFVVVAGMGVCHLVDRAGDRAAKILVARAAILFAIGVFLRILWEADILAYYAVFFLLATGAIGGSIRQLGMAAAVFTLMFPVLYLTLDYAAGWDTGRDGLMPQSPLDPLRNLLFNGYHPAVPWFAFMLFGMILARCSSASPLIWRVGAALAAGVVLIAELIVPAAVAGMGEIVPILVDDMLGADPIPPSPVFMISAAASSFVVIALARELARLGPRELCAPLIAVGRTTLSGYVAHIIVGMYVMEGLIDMEERSLSFALGYGLGFWLTWALVADWLLRRARHGPLETLLRAGTVLILRPYASSPAMRSPKQTQGHAVQRTPE